MYAVTVMCIHDVCIVRLYVFIHVSTVFMPILCCVFKTVYRVLYVFQIHIDFKFTCLRLYCLWINMCNNFELYRCLGIFG